MIAFTKKTPAGKGRSFTRYKVSSVASVSQIGLELKGAEIWKRIDVIFMPDIQVSQFNAIRNIRIVFVVNYPRLKSQACRKGIFPHYNLPGYSQLA